MRSCVIDGRDTWPVKKEHEIRLERAEAGMLSWMQSITVTIFVSSLGGPWMTASCLSLSGLMAIFPGGPTLAGTSIYTSPFWILLELRMMEVIVATGAITRSKLQSNHHHQQTHIQLFTGRTPFLSPNQQCRSTEGNWISS